jgi:hypothetical protein
MRYLDGGFIFYVFLLGSIDPKQKGYNGSCIVVAPHYNACQENIPTAKSTHHHRYVSQEEVPGCHGQRHVLSNRRPYPPSLFSEKRRSLVMYKKIILYKKIS